MENRRNELIHISQAEKEQLERAFFVLKTAMIKYNVTQLTSTDYDSVIIVGMHLQPIKYWS